MRKSTVHYIAPSTISVTPNANGSADDLAVYVMRGARIKVCSKGVPELVIDAATNSFMEWSFAGRNRRLADSARPYTIYARLSKTDVSDGYLVFAAKEGEGQDWLDKYPYVTPEGLAGDTAGYGTGNYWYIRLGDVSLPEDGKRTVTLDTGVLGTDVFNADWYLNPDRNPLRVELSCTIGNQEKGRTPYVCWGESVVLTASLVEGWESDASGKVDHWTISRDTGNADSDASWNAVDRSRTFGVTGIITLAHNRGGDHFAGAVAATFTVKAWGEPEAQEPLAETVITILAETEETYSLEASDAAVTYNPLTQSYSPSGGVTFRIRAKAQDGSVSYLSQQQIQAALLHVYYLPADEEAGEDPVPELTFVNGTATLPVSAFSDGKSVNLWIENDAQAVLDRATVAYVRFGEKGDAPVTCYRWYRKGLTPLVPTDVTSEEPSPASGDASGAANVYPLDKWSRTSPNRPSTGDWLLWMCESIHHGSGTIDAWHGPVRVSGEDGDPGADSSDREYIYKGLATYPFSGTLPANITTDTGGTERTAEYIATHDDFVPQGWSDTAIPTDDTNNKYVYIAIREKAAGHNQQWGAFSAPALWSNWGMQGIDGDGVQYVYKLFDHELSAAERESNIPVKPASQTHGEWIPAGWSDDPLAPTESMQYCYCSTIKKIGGTWAGAFDTLGLWSRFSLDGEDGNTPIQLFKWAQSAPDAPAVDGAGWATPDPYNGWYKAAQNRPSDANNILYMSQNTLEGDGTIDPTAWSTPVQVSGNDGDPGADSSDREYIYKGLATYPFSGTPPANITTDTGGTERTAEYIATHDDFVPQGWSDTAIPTDDTNNKYVYIAIREKAAGHNQQWGAFSAPALWSNWGMQGIDGDGVQYLYKLFDHELSDAERTSSIPANATFNNTTKEWEAAGWSDDPQAPTSAMPFCYCSIIQKLNGQWQTITGGYGRFQKLGLWSKWADDAVNYRLIVRPDGIICDTTTGNVTNGDFSVEVWRTAGDGEDEHVQDLSDYGLSIVASASGEEPDQSGEKRSAVVTRTWGDDQVTFDSLLAEFNAKLSALGKSQVSDSGSTSDIYEWLLSCYEKADYEWNAEESDFFSEDTYPIPVNYRGNNTEYRETAYNAMQSWLMATCLAELIPTRDTSGTLTNNQTELFRLAWDIAHGDTVPLFNDYDIHADPMIARFAANMIYHVMHGKKEFSDFDTMRSHIGGSAVDLYDNEYGYVGSSRQAPSQLGYMVNVDAIIPDAPGPYADGQKDRQIGGKARVLPSDGSQFYLSENVPANQNWWPYNYKKDVEIDSRVCEEFRLSVPGLHPNQTEGNAAAEAAKNVWDDYPVWKKTVMLKAVTAPYATSRYFFGSKRLRLNAVSSGHVAAGNYTNPITGETYTKGTEYDKDIFFFKFGIGDSSDMLIGGPFADLQDVMVTGSWGDGTNFGTNTDTLAFMKFVEWTGDNSRYPVYRPEYGRRRRPLGNKNTDGGHRSECKPGGPIYGDPLDGVTNISTSMIFADKSEDYIKYSCGSGWSGDPATSYPSGHSAQAWGIAMILGQMYSKTNDKKIIQYATGAYELGVGRILSRHHWTSDTILGRLCATMIMPIFNAIDHGTFRTDYANARTAILGGVSGGLTIVVTNKSGAPMTIKPQTRFVLRNGSVSVTTSRIQLPANEDLVTIANGETKTFRGVTLDSASRNYLGLPFAKSNEWVINPGTPSERTYRSNIIFYDYDDNSGTYIMPWYQGRSMFVDNATYSIEFISNGIGNVTIEANGGGGSDAVITVNLNLTNQSGKTVTLDGDINFVLANPDSRGWYYGWTGVYNRSGHIVFSSSKVTMANGDSRQFTLRWEHVTEEIMDASGNVVQRNVTSGLGYRKPLEQSLIPSSGRASNVLLYVDGEAETSKSVTCDILPSVLFEEGNTYNITFR